MSTKTYIGYFASIQKNKHYRVEILVPSTAASDSSIEINLGAEPFSTQQNSSGDTIYTPIKSGTATIEIVSNPMYFDLYSSRATDNRVYLYDASTNTVVWCGYTRPNTYNSAFAHELETYQLEALDPLSILQYIDYEIIDGSTKGFATFTQIINKMLSKVGLITHWYFSKNTRIVGRNTTLCDDCTVSECNFFDEDEEPMKCKEVLEYLCKFCSVSAVCKGSEIYFLDYDAIKHGVNGYSKYVVGNNTSIGSINLYQNYTLDSSCYYDSNTSITLDNVYNKVTVKDSLYTVDNLLPDVFDEDDLENITDASHYWNSTYKSEGSYITVDKNGWQEFWGAKDEYKYFYSSHKCFKNKKKWLSRYYDNNGNEVSAPNVIDGSIAKNYIGCSPAKYYVVSDKDSVAAAKEGTISYDNYLFFFQNKKDVYNKVLFETNDLYASKFFVPSNAKFIFSGKLLFSVADYNNVTTTNGSVNYPYLPIPTDTGISNQDTLKDGDHFAFGCVKNTIYYKDASGWHSVSMTGNQPFICFKLGMNGKYLTNVNNSTWGTTEPRYPLEIPITIGDQIEKSITSNVTVDDGIDSEGFLIKCPVYGTEYCSPSDFHFRFYGFHSFFAESCSAIWLKDFKLTCVVPTNDTDTENKTDTEYTYTIDEDFINELSDIEFKICTYDDKEANYSAVAYKPDATHYKFVDKLTNDSLTTTEGNVRAEQWLMYRIVNQYKTPAKKLESTLFNNILPYAKVYDPVTNAYYIVNGMSHNYRYDSCNYTLTEKQ